MFSKLQEKVPCVRRERKLNFGNEITKILVLPMKCPKCMLGECPKWKPIVAVALPKMRGKKKIVATKLSKMEGKKKKDTTSTTFFTTNYKWLVVIGSNLNLTLRLLFGPNNNNQ